MTQAESYLVRAVVAFVVLMSILHAGYYFVSQGFPWGFVGWLLVLSGTVTSVSGIAFWYERQVNRVTLSFKMSEKPEEASKQLETVRELVNTARETEDNSYRLPLWVSVSMVASGVVVVVLGICSINRSWYPGLWEKK